MGSYPLLHQVDNQSSFGEKVRRVSMVDLSKKPIRKMITLFFFITLTLLQATTGCQLITVPTETMSIIQI